jgi:hypothetical protein
MRLSSSQRDGARLFEKGSLFDRREHATGLAFLSIVEVDGAILTDTDDKLSMGTAHLGEELVGIPFAVSDMNDAWMGTFFVVGCALQCLFRRIDSFWPTSTLVVEQPIVLVPELAGILTVGHPTSMDVWTDSEEAQRASLAVAGDRQAGVEIEALAVR